MKLKELLRRLSEYYERDIIPPATDVSDESEGLDPAVVGTPQIESDEIDDIDDDDESLEEDDESDSDNYDAEEDVYPDNLKEFQKITVVRHGQKMRILPPKKGFKRVGEKYVKMSAQEQKVKSKIAKKGWKKKKPFKAKINKQRAKSMKRRKSI